MQLLVNLAEARAAPNRKMDRSLSENPSPRRALEKADHGIVPGNSDIESLRSMQTNA
jgi:hypothetical protein